MEHIHRPDTAEYPEYYHTYISKTSGDDIVSLLRNGLQEVEALIKDLPADKLDFRYQSGKWTIKEILVHLMDAERIFSYRALRFSRGDKTGLPGFDEDEYVPNSEASERSAESILSEYRALRMSTIAFFENMTLNMLTRSGFANGQEISVRSLAYIIPGHEIHHLAVIRERYL